MTREGLHHAGTASSDQVDGRGGWLLAALAFYTFGGHCIETSTRRELGLSVLVRG